MLGNDALPMEFPKDDFVRKGYIQYLSFWWWILGVEVPISSINQR